MWYRYTVLLERGETEDVWVASVPALPGCVTQGATVDELLARAQEAVGGSLDALVALGAPAPVEAVTPTVATLGVTVSEPTLPVGAGASETA